MATGTQTALALNYTKYAGGGSGDNIIANGFIKTVKQVWLDSYTMAQVYTKTFIALAEIPVGRKLVDVQVSVETTVAQSSGSIGLGFLSDAFDAEGSLFPKADVCHNLTVSSISLLGGAHGLGTLATGYTLGKTRGCQKEITGTQTVIALQLNNWTMSSGVIRSVVSYT